MLAKRLFFILFSFTTLACAPTGSGSTENEALTNEPESPAPTTGGEESPVDTGAEDQLNSPEDKKDTKPGDLPAAECQPITPVENIDNPKSDPDGPYTHCGGLGLGHVRFHDYTPNGDIVVGTNAGHVGRFNPSGKRLWIARIQDDPIATLAISPDGRFIAASENGRVHVLSAKTGELVQLITPYKPLVLSMAFSPNGCELAIGTLVDKGEPGVQVVALADTAVIWSGVFKEATIALEYSPDGTQLGAVVKGNGYTLNKPTPVWVHVLDAVDGKLVKSMSGESFAWSIDGAAVYVGRESGEVARVDIKTGTSVGAMTYAAVKAKGPTPRNVRAIRALPDGRVLTAGKATNDFVIHDGETLETQLQASFYGLHGIALSPDGDTVSLLREGQIYIRTTKDQEVASEALLVPVFQGRIDLSEGGLVSATTTDGVVHLYDIHAEEERLQVDVDVTGIAAEQSAISADGSVMAVATGTEILVIDLNSDKELGTLQGAPGKPSVLAVSPDGTYVAAATSASSISVWRTDDLMLDRVLPEAPINTSSAIFAQVSALTFSPDGTLLAAGGGGFYQTRVWRLDDNNETKLGPKASALTFSPTGNAIVTAALFQAPLRRFEVPEYEFSDLPVQASGYKGLELTWNPYGIVVSGTKTRIYDEFTGEVIQELRGSRDVQATSDGKILVIASSSRTVEIYCATE